MRRALRKFWLPPLLSFLALAVLFTAVGTWTYWRVQRSVLAYVDGNLRTVVRLKSDQVSHWLEEVEESIEIEADRRPLARATREWRLQARSLTSVPPRILDLLAHVCSSPPTVECSLHAPQDAALWASNGYGTRYSSLPPQAAVALRDAEPQLEDFHVEVRNDRRHAVLGYLYALREAPVPAPAVALLHVTIDSGGMFDVVAGKWPGLSASVETLLLRGDGRRATPDAEAEPATGAGANVSEIDRLAVAGAKDLLQGRDDAGHDVLAYALPVAGTPWFVLTKVDRSEAFAELNTIAILFALAVGVVALISCISWSERRRHREARSREQTERRRLEAERAAHVSRLQELSHRIVAVQERECRVISSELHDRAGANLAAIKLNLSAILKSAPVGTDESLAALIAETEELLMDTIAEFRELCTDLSSSVLEHVGLVEALESRALQFTRRTGLEVTVRSDDFEDRFSPDVESMLFRIVQEALNNCKRHAGARRVSIHVLRANGRIELTVDDDGTGFDLAHIDAAAAGAGQGLKTMRERAEFAGARFSLWSEPGRGTRIRVELDASNAFAGVT
jgi:signal transduction histidine kinase